MKTDGVIVTNAGLDLLNEAISKSVPVLFTTMKIGTGDVSSIDNAKKLTNLVTLFLDIGLTSITKQSDGYMKFRGAFTNENFKNEVSIKEVGLYAKIGEHGQERLFAYVNDGAGEVFPPFSSGNIVEKTRDLILGITDRAQVTTVLEKNLIYATMFDLEEQIEVHMQEEFKILIGSRYRGYEPLELPGQVHFRDKYFSVAVEFPDNSSTKLLSEISIEKCRKLVQLRGEEEINFHIGMSHSPPVVGFEMQTTTLVKSHVYIVGFTRHVDTRIIGMDFPADGSVLCEPLYTENINSSPQLTDRTSEYAPVHHTAETGIKSYTY